jgi:zinc transport system permease protein
LAVATSFNVAPLEVSIPVVLLTAFLLLRISENAKIKGDAAIALISSSALAIGVMTISVTTGMNTDVCNYMFGSILAMSKSDVYLSIVVAVIVLTLYILFYNRIFAVTFDENFAKGTGMNVSRYNMLIAFLTAMVIVVGMRLMGALLISSLIIFPALTAMRVFSSFRRVILCSAALSVVCFFVGMLLSFALSTPAGASIVIVNLAVFCLFSAAAKLRVKASKCKGNIRRNRMSKKFLVALGGLILVTAAGFVQQTLTASSQERQIVAENSLPSPGDSKIFEIREKMFIQQCTDIYLNPGDYVGRRVKLEGLYEESADEESGEISRYVIRYGPGCCGNDGVAGFECFFQGDAFPSQGDWVEVIGTVTIALDPDDLEYVVLKPAQFEVKDERGAEFVEN